MRLTAAAAVIALVLAGCGSSGRAGAPAATAIRSTPTKSGASNESAGPSRLIARADAVCRQVNRQLIAAPASLDASQIARDAPRNAALERRAVAQLRKLTPPASLARDWRQILAYRQTLAGQLVELAKYVKALDVRHVQALAASKKQTHRKLAGLAIRDGFKDCANVGAERHESPRLLTPLPARRQSTL